MNRAIYEYRDYKAYLRDWIAARPAAGRGERSRIAGVVGCHLAYLSRVLGGEADLSAEQAHALNAYLGHGAEESDFFLLLVQAARAGTRSLRDHYEEKLRREVERRSVLKNRAGFRKTLAESAQATYFSAWYYAAIHLLIAIPRFQTRESLTAYLGLPRARVGEVLRFLVETGLAVEEGGRYRAGSVNIHLGNDSTMIQRHHTNWRLRAVQSLEREVPEELHYSSVVTIARRHVPEVRAILIRAIEDIRAVVRGSEEEALFCYAVDLFEVGAGA